MKVSKLYLISLSVVVFSLIAINADAQYSYSLYVANESQPDAKTYQFDIYLLSTGISQMELASIQIGLGFDTSILNGGTPSFVYCSSTSELASSQVLTSFSIGAPNQFNSVDNIVYRYINFAPKIGPGSGYGTLISRKIKNCKAPGTRIGTYQIKNTLPFKPNSTCKHIFNSIAAAGRTNTSVSGYINSMNTTLTSFNRYRFNDVGNCLKNLVLNNCKNDTISENSQTSIDSLIWHGTKYTTSGMKYWKAGYNLMGCDSFKSILLTINKSKTSSFRKETCISYCSNLINYNYSSISTEYPVQLKGEKKLFMKGDPCDKKLINYLK